MNKTPETAFFLHGVQSSIENFLHLSVIFGSDGWRTEHKIQKQQRMWQGGYGTGRRKLDILHKPKERQLLRTKVLRCTNLCLDPCQKISWHFRLQSRPIKSYWTNRLGDFNLTKFWDFNCWCLHQRCVFDCCDRPCEGSGSVYPDSRAHWG